MSRQGNSIPGIDRRPADVQPVSASSRPGEARSLAEARRCAMNRLSLVVSIALLASGSAAAVIVEQAKPTPTYETALARSWEEVHNKVLTMAKDTAFPDDKLAWRPHRDSRSVMEELRHVTIGLEMTTA